MIKVGITGGIGSGKTTFGKEWEKLGAFVLYADDFAKQLMSENEELKQKIRDTFGEQSYTEDGKLNRAYLADEAFTKGRVSELNEIVHPVLWKEADKLAAQKEKEGMSVFAKEAAILLNDGRPKDIDYVILLLADKELRVKRTSDRDEVKEKEVLDRINKQPVFENLTHLADFIVENTGTVEELKKKSRVIYKFLKDLSLNN